MAWSRHDNLDGSSITEGVIWRQLLIFFFPILLGTLFQQLYNTADAMIVGKYVGKEALAAVGGTTGVLINLLVGFFVGLSSGATVLISQFFGARREQDVGDAVHTAAAMALVGGVLMMALGLTLSPAVLRLMGTPGDIMDDAVTYIRIYFGGIVFSLIYNVGSGILRAMGDSRRPLYFLIVACLTNIVLDVVLVMGLDMGVAGAALATVISQMASAGMVIMTLCRLPMAFRLQPRRIRLHRSLLSAILRIGFPAGLQSVMYSLSNMMIQRSVNAFGTDTVAAWTAYGKMDGLVWSTISAFGVAVTTFAGQNFGARRFDRMKRSVWVCLGMTAAATVVLSGFLLAFGRVLFHAFADDENVVRIGLEILWLLVPCYMTYLCIEIISGAMRGAGDSLIPTLLTLVGVCLLRVVWLWAVAPRFGSLRAVLLCYPITWSLTSVLFLVYYLRGRWLKRCMKKAGMTESSG